MQQIQLIDHFKMSITLLLVGFLSVFSVTPLHRTSPALITMDQESWQLDYGCPWYKACRSYNRCTKDRCSGVSDQGVQCCYKGGLAGSIICWGSGVTMTIAGIPVISAWLFGLGCLSSITSLAAANEFVRRHETESPCYIFCEELYKVPEKQKNFLTANPESRNLFICNGTQLSRLANQYAEYQRTRIASGVAKIQGLLKEMAAGREIYEDWGSHHKLKRAISKLEGAVSPAFPLLDEQGKFFRHSRAYRIFIQMLLRELPDPLIPLMKRAWPTLWALEADSYTGERFNRAINNFCNHNVIKAKHVPQRAKKAYENHPFFIKENEDLQFFNFIETLGINPILRLLPVELWACILSFIPENDTIFTAPLPPQIVESLDILVPKNWLIGKILAKPFNEVETLYGVPLCLSFYGVKFFFEAQVDYKVSWLLKELKCLNFKEAVDVYGASMIRSLLSDSRVEEWREEIENAIKL